MAYIRKWQYLRFVISSRRALAIINTILVLSFLSRGIYQILSITMGVRIHFPELPLQREEDVSLLLFVLFMFWDYIPLTLIIMTVTSHSSRVLALMSIKMTAYRGIADSTSIYSDDMEHNLPFSYQGISPPYSEKSPMPSPQFGKNSHSSSSGHNNNNQLHPVSSSSPSMSTTEKEYKRSPAIPNNGKS
eukprot:gene15679-33129_t